jgi:CheY-like chemotaxis protein
VRKFDGWITPEDFPGRPRRALIVPGGMRDYLRALLAPRYTVVAVPDGEAALAAARQRLPDLALAGVMMPRLDGFGLLERLRADPATSAVPVILLSARAGEEARVEGLAREIKMAHSGAAAVERARDFQPQLILCDLGMPGMDGYETCRQLRRLPGLEKTVIAVVSGYGGEEDRRKSQEAGFDRHLAKPIGRAVLEELVKSAAAKK